MTAEETKVNKTLKELNEFFEKLIRDDPEFIGSCEVNFFKGSVPNVNIKKSVKFYPRKLDGKMFA